jgi:uncharacterized SAM-binding protein YcdF (DUF218 family)
VTPAPRQARAPGRILAQLLIGGAVCGALLAAYAIWRIEQQGSRDESRPADAVVVLGAAQYNGVPSGVFEARLQHAVDVYLAGDVEWFVVTGGKLPEDHTTEAATARSWAILHGVPAEKIIGENQGRTTLESLEAVAALFAERGLRSAVFVSDETHMLRVLRMASDLGIQAWGSPTRSSPSDQDAGRRWKATLHELAGLAAYYVGRSRFLDDAATTSGSGP